MDYFLPFAQERRLAGARSGSLAANVDGGEGLVQARANGARFSALWEDALRDPHGEEAL
jgi:hypothetical protein